MKLCSRRSSCASLRAVNDDSNTACTAASSDPVIHSSAATGDTHNTAAANGTYLSNFMVISVLPFESWGIHLATIRIGRQVDGQINRRLRAVIEHGHTLLTEAVTQSPLHSA